MDVTVTCASCATGNAGGGDCAVTQSYGTIQIPHTTSRIMKKMVEIYIRMCQCVLEI